MERRFKGLVAINDVLDDRYQKLSDRYHSLELSHKRKKKALKEIRDFLYDLPVVGGCFMPLYQITDIELQRLLLLCDDALFCDGRERVKSLKNKKTTIRTVKRVLKARKNG